MLKRIGFCEEGKISALFSPELLRSARDYIRICVRQHTNRPISLLLKKLHTKVFRIKSNVEKWFPERTILAQSGYKETQVSCKSCRPTGTVDLAVAACLSTFAGRKSDILKLQPKLIVHACSCADNALGAASATGWRGNIMLVLPGKTVSDLFANHEAMEAARMRIGHLVKKSEWPWRNHRVMCQRSLCFFAQYS